MSLLSIENVHKTYGDRHLLRGVQMVVGDEDRIGLVGPNGCGKSTLLRILAGVEGPDDGQRVLRRGLRIGYLDQEPEVDPGLTVRENVRAGLGARDEVLAELETVHEQMGEAGDDVERMERLLARQATLEERIESMGGHDVDHRIESVIADVGLPDADASCAVLSGGERRRVALARLLLSGPELMLLDEPTNHLDPEVVDWLEETLQKQRVAMVLVTHDRYFLDRVVNSIIEVDRGELHLYEGGYADFLEQRAHRLEIEKRTEATRLNLLRRETEWMRRGPPARTTKSKSRIGRYHQLKDAAPEAGSGDLEFEIPCGTRLGEKVLNVAAVSKSYGDRKMLDGFDLEMTRGDRIGIVGPNGAGKTTLLRILLGLLEPDHGQVERGSTVQFSFLDQGREDLTPTNTVIEEIGGGNDYIHVGERKLRIESFLEAMLFPKHMARSLVGDLSGGERNRVLLAKLLSTAGNVLVLDEPTNDLDLMTLRVLEEALVAFEGAAIVVSHDRWFLDRVATRVIHLDGHGGHRVWNGDLSLLLERLAEEREARREKERAAANKERAARRAEVEAERQQQKLNYREQKELQGLPDKIAKLEEEIAAIDEKLLDPALYEGDDADLKRLTAEREQGQAKLDEFYTRWEELESANDG